MNLEFAPGDEARAEQMGGYVAVLYGRRNAFRETALPAKEQRPKVVKADKRERETPLDCEGLRKRISRHMSLRRMGVLLDWNANYIPKALRHGYMSDERLAVLTKKLDELDDYAEAVKR